MAGQFEKGFCYLNLFDNNVDESARDKLGYCPTIAAIRRHVNSNANCLADGVFQVTLGVDGGGLVAHVIKAKEGESGVRAHEIVAAFDKSLRVGMSTSVPVKAAYDELPPAHTGARMELVPSGAIDRDVRVAFAIDQSTQGFTFKPRDNAWIVRLGMMFESVHLLSASFTFHVTGDNSSQLRCAVNEYTFAPTSNLGWAQAPINLWATGNVNGSTTTVLELLETHPFGREIKAPALGVGDPVFHFQFTSDVPSLAVCRGTLRLRFSGVGLGSAINIAREAGRKPSAPPPFKLHRAEPVDDESSEDDEKPSPQRASRVAVNRPVAK